MVDQVPFPGAFRANAFGHRAKDIRQVAPHAPLVDQARQPAGARQHAQQGHFRQADGGGAVVDHGDLVAGQGQLVTAAGRGAIEGRQELQAGVLAGVLEAVAGFIGELAEVDLPGVGRQAQHVDVGPRAEHARLGAGDDDALDLRMLEAQALRGIVQLDVHAKVVRIQLEFVTRAYAAIFLNVEHEAGDRSAVGKQFPMPVLCRFGIVGDQHGIGGG
ncbi:MAG: hypothetical protein BWY11_00010 [Firmicutes bacterium ADurb.Bin182]|nr:MAG: hypothetical protein BWY11_00010 [Firmicutes bacterium ADurb.Bin182]